jgi:hypothetical protein
VLDSDINDVKTAVAGDRCAFEGATQRLNAQGFASMNRCCAPALRDLLATQPRGTLIVAVAGRPLPSNGCRRQAGERRSALRCIRVEVGTPAQRGTTDSLARIDHGSAEGRVLTIVSSDEGPQDRVGG